MQTNKKQHQIKLKNIKEYYQMINIAKSGNIKTTQTNVHQLGFVVFRISCSL